METQRAFKLFRVRKDGTLGSLFVDCPARLPLGKWMWYRDDIKPKTLAYRPGWHCCVAPVAPHLRDTGPDRRWYEVEIAYVREEQRPEAQGGTWLLAKRLRILNPVS